MRSARLVPGLRAGLAILALLAPPAAAQATHPFEGVQHTHPWPQGAGASGPYTRGAAADLDGDLVRDVTILDGGQPVAFLGIDEWLAPTNLPLTANDVDALACASPDGRDALVVVNATGVQMCWLSEATHTFSMSTLAAGAFAGSELVRSGDLDGDGATDILALGADGLTFRPLFGQSGGGFAAGTTFTALDTVRDVVLLRWDGDLPLEVAVLSDSGVEVYDLDGSVLSVFTSVLPGGCLCLLRQVGQSQDRLAWITEYAPPASQWLMVLSPAGSSDVIDLGALDAVAAVNGDYDLDGDDDVLISHRYSHDLLWFENRRSPSNPLGPTFTTDGMRTFQVGPPSTEAPDNEAWPVAVDLDRDGDLDVAFAVELTAELRVLRGEPVVEDEQRAGVVSGEYSLPAGAPQGTLTLLLSQPAAMPSGATHLEVDLWRQADLGESLEAQAVGHLVLPIASWPMSVPVAIPEATSTFGAIYHVQVRLAEHDAYGERIDAFPPQALAFTVVLATATAIASMPGSGTPMTVAGPWEQDDPVYGGRSVPMRSICPFPLGGPPKKVSGN